MATSSLYGNSSESIGLYGIGSASGGTYFEWFIFYDSATAPATPTGGSWSFTTNTGTPPTGWLASPPPSPTNQVWVSLAIVDSRSTAALTWSVPGLMSSMGSTIANYITFVATSAPAYSSGRLWYDSTQNALSYYNDITNNTIHIGQETQLKVRNTTGATIAKGAPVYVLPTASGFGYPLVALAQADTATKANSIGLANQAIPNNTDGYIVINGLLTGANTGTFAVGDVLYLSPYSAGQLMNTVPPTGYAVRIGVVAFSNTPNGTIYVNESNAFVLAGNIVGTIGITNGGTGATTASGARTSLGLGTVATQDANNVAITGGSITGITDLAIADGGTGASNAAGALANLGAVGLTDTQTLTNKTISGASNTLTNIGNSSLTNSSVTINGSGISLGGTATITAATPNNLVFGSGLSASGNFNGSVATNVTLANVGTAATYGDSGTIPVFTTNAFGQISSVSLQSVVVDSTDISGTIAIAQGGTGASSAANARINLLPSYAGNAGEVLALNAGGTDVEWRAIAGTGTVSSVAVSGGTTGLTTSGGPITAAGTITLAGTLATTNGGTGLTSFTSGGVVYASSTSALATGSALTFDGTNTRLGVGGNPSVTGIDTGVTNLFVVAPNTNSGQAATFITDANGRGILIANQAKTSSFGVGASAGLVTIGTNTSSTSLAFSITASEQMRLTSTGLGIGTSSPSAKLTIAGASEAARVIHDNGFVSFYNTANTTRSGYVQINTASTSNITVEVAQALAFSTNNLERARISASGDIGINTTNMLSKLNIANSYISVGSNSNTTQTNILLQGFGFSNSATIFGNTSIRSTYNQGTNAASLEFYTAASGTNTAEVMRISSAGNVGIGTTSPQVLLHVNSASADGGKILISSGTLTNNNRAGLFMSATNVNGQTGNVSIECNHPNNQQSDMVFRTGATDSNSFGTERMRLDTSGNLGLGVTPSAWATVIPAFQIGGAGGYIAAQGSAEVLRIGSNNYFNASFKYVINGFASRYEQTSGTHLFYTAPSGTAGNTITFTQAMTLDASGNLGVGTTSPSTYGKFVVQASGNAIIARSGNTSFCEINVQSGTSDDIKGQFQAILGSSNKVIIGSRTNHPLAFNIADTEVARIDTSGNLLVGTTSQVRTGDRMSVVGSGANVATFQQNTNTSGFNVLASNLQANGNNTSSYHFWGNTSGVGNWYLYGNGTTSYSSDERLKKNIVTTRNGYIDDLCKLRVVKYNWKNDAEGTPQELGLIAQEVEQVFPNLVQNDINPVEEGGEIYKQVKQSVLPFMLLKAIQELKAEFDAYKASHP